MADHQEVFQKINKVEGISYPVLTPNIKGFERYEFILLLLILFSEEGSLKNRKKNKNNLMRELI
jgi:hypothetical protein